MFKSKQTSLTPRNMKSSVMQNSIVITGNIVTNGDLHVDCKLDGSITSRKENIKIVIDQNAQITGDIKAASVEIYGLVRGNILCKDIVLRKKSQVKGNISYQSIEMEPEAQVDGELHKGLIEKK